MIWWCNDETANMCMELMSTCWWVLCSWCNKKLRIFNVVMQYLIKDLLIFYLQSDIPQSIKGNFLYVKENNVNHNCVVEFINILLFFQVIFHSYWCFVFKSLISYLLILLDFSYFWKIHLWNSSFSEIFKNDDHSFKS